MASGVTTGGLREMASPAPAVTRAAALLQVLADAGSTPLGLADLARQLELPKSSIANLCVALEDAGLIHRSSRGYMLGRRLLEFGSAYLRSMDELQDFHESCRGMRTVSQETLLLATLDGVDVLYLARHDGTQPIRLASDVGRRMPAGCTALGKAMLSRLEPAVVEERYRQLSAFPVLTPNGAQNLSELLDDLERTRERGYAVDDEENTVGVKCVAMALDLADPRESPRAVSCTMLKARAIDDLVEKVLADLTDVCRNLSNRINLGQGQPTRT